MRPALRNAVFTVVSLLFCLTLLTGEEATAQEIPVYPGAKLEMPAEAAEDCCNFITASGLRKVLSFYEAALKTPALDVNAVGAKYPELKPQLKQMTAQMPATMKINFFVLRELNYNGKKAPELFEVVSGPQGVRFTVVEHQFTAEDAHFAGEWRDGMIEAGSGQAPLKPCDPALLVVALPATAADGFSAGEVYSEGGGEGRQSTASIHFAKLVRKGSGGEAGTDDKYVGLQVSISDYLGDRENAESFIKPERKEERALTVLGLTRGRRAWRRILTAVCRAKRSFWRRSAI